MDIKAIIMTVLNYFWEVFKYWGIIPENVVAEAEKLPKVEY